MNELSTIAASLGTLLKERKQTIAVAESSAGGLISAALLAVPGASAYFLGGGVIYTQAARRTLLRVPDERVTGIRSSTDAGSSSGPGAPPCFRHQYLEMESTHLRRTWPLSSTTSHAVFWRLGSAFQ